MVGQTSDIYRHQEDSKKLIIGMRDELKVMYEENNRLNDIIISYNK